MLLLPGNEGEEFWLQWVQLENSCFILAEVTLWLNCLFTDSQAVMPKKTLTVFKFCPLYTLS